MNKGLLDTDIMSSGLSNTFIVSDLTAGSSYKYKVRAENSCGFGPFSDIVYVTEPDKMNKVEMKSSRTKCSA